MSTLKVNIKYTICIPVNICQKFHKVSMSESGSKSAQVFKKKTKNTIVHRRFLLDNGICRATLDKNQIWRTKSVVPLVAVPPNDPFRMPNKIVRGCYYYATPFWSGALFQGDPRHLSRPARNILQWSLGWLDFPEIRNVHEFATWYPRIFTYFTPNHLKHFPSPRCVKQRHS